MENYIVIQWDIDSDGTCHNNMYLFNSLENALEHYNYLVNNNTELNPKQRELRYFISRRDYVENRYNNNIDSEYFEDWDYRPITELCVAEISELENDKLVYKERLTYGGWKRYIGVILTLFKTPTSNCLGNINISFP
jgi:hypothetical protein